MLPAENERLLNPGHLESLVIGQGDFEWDFRCLKPGFWNLVSPFMQHPSGSSHILLLALEELGVTEERRTSLIPIIEYSHFFSLVNDYYSLHPALNQSKPDRFVAAKLTQLKYAAQFLAVYPKYLVLRNLMGADLETRNRLHTAMFQFAVILGASRSLFLDWARRSYADITTANYHQCAVYTLSGYLLGPVILACILAGVSEKETRQIKTAFSWLTIVAKLELERRVVSGETPMPADPLRVPEFIVNSFPGGWWLEQLQTQAVRTAGFEPFPDFRRMYRQAVVELRLPLGAAGGRKSKSVVREALAKFQATMTETKLLPGLTANLVAAFHPGGQTL